MKVILHPTASPMARPTGTPMMRAIAVPTETEPMAMLRCSSDTTFTAMATTDDQKMAWDTATPIREANSMT